MGLGFRVWGFKFWGFRSLGCGGLGFSIITVIPVSIISGWGPI